jgi:hypothetical protein
MKWIPRGRHASGSHAAATRLLRHFAGSRPRFVNVLSRARMCRVGMPRKGENAAGAALVASDALIFTGLASLTQNPEDEIPLERY